MSIFVISYDLRNKESSNYEELFKVIKAAAVGQAWHCLDSTWLIESNYSAEQIRTACWAKMYSDDKVIVVQYAPPHSAWEGFTGECQTWLQTHM